ncbi:MAG: cytochrome c biogenesis protein CcsA [Pirellulales bacterium]
MATVEVGTARPITARDGAARATKAREGITAISLLYAIASLRLTVTLFALSIFLVFAGTLAQVDHDVWEVVNNTYFHTWFAWIEWQAFARLIGMFYQADWNNITGGFYFPGGQLIGVCLAANLLAAHALRFKVVATGKQLWIGLGLIVAGAIATWLAITSGTNDTVESELSATFNNSLWHLLRGGVAGLALTGAYVAVLSYRRIRGVEWLLLVVVDGLLICLAAWLFMNPEVKLDSSGLRILWQLAKGTGAALLLLAGCVFLFRKRAGVVVLHGGIGLLMASVFWTGIAADEANMAIDQGQEVGWVYDNRATELAVIDASSSDVDRVTVIPLNMLKEAGATGEVISHADLPFDIKVVRYLQNSSPNQAIDEKNLATAGAGLQYVAEEARAATGVDTKQGIDFPSAYVELIDKGSRDSLGTYLVSSWGEEWLRMRAVGPFLQQVRQALEKQAVQVGEKSYEIALRFKRTYKDYSVRLKEFKNDFYVGTNTTKNYSSLVQLRDPGQSIDREFLIWMNNPLRYAGDTLYQASFDENNMGGTILQVVTNPGWMAPYIACMIVGIGMLAHFGITLSRFIDRRNRDALRPITTAAAPRAARPFSLESFKSSSVWFPTLVVLLMGGYVLGKARVPTAKIAGMDVQGFAAAPLADGGRIKPFETLARNTLQVISGKQVVEKRAKTTWERITRGGEKPIPASVWLLDCISETRHAEDHRIFRIDNLDVLEVLGLESRPGFFRYSYREINKKLADSPTNVNQPPRTELDHQISLAAGVEETKRDLFQARIIDLANRRQLYQAVVFSYRSPAIRMDQENIRSDLDFAAEQAAKLRESHAPRSVPPPALDAQWKTLFEAELDVMVDQVLSRELNPATKAMSGMLLAYAKGDAREFNTRLADFHEAVETHEEQIAQASGSEQFADLAPAERINQSKIDFEVFFNHFSPFYYAAVLYLVAFVLACMSWLGWSLPLSRASTWLIVLTFLLHTFALVGRIYISGRPPVTNLYSSAIFIGWACVLLGLVLEGMYKMGVGNIVASVIGFATLVIAHFLSLDGDTFTVLQAVLDTQFWLATHVVCITLGYSTTFLAGVIGILYILGAHVVPKFDGPQRQQLTRMIYGTLCFSIFFSFIGTVLGGLWADDSWGRFWGWDPKENGALLIVLWNAILLHARWGAIVGPRGLATLAVGGNIVTAWSWFGVNELGVGLHAYGGFSDSTATWLLIFMASQLAIVALGCLPSELFRAGRKPAAV